MGGVSRKGGGLVFLRRMGWGLEEMNRWGGGNEEEKKNMGGGGG